MFEESISQFVNPAKEEASLDTRTGAAWSGLETDEVSRGVRALQPVETILWKPARTDADARLCAIAADCIAGRAPSLVPVDDAEKLKFRNVWQYCAETNADLSPSRILHHPFVFSSALGVFARDVFVRVNAAANDVAVILFTGSGVGDLRCTESHSPLSVFSSAADTNQASLLLAMQMCVLVCGRYCSGTPFAWPFAVSVADCTDGQQFYDETGNAALMIALRSRTAWYREHMKTMPF